MKKYEMIRDYRKSPKKVYENIGDIKGTHRERGENGEIICELDFQKLLDECFLLQDKLNFYLNENFFNFETDSKTYPGETFPFINYKEEKRHVLMARSNPENYIIAFVAGEFSREWYEFHIIAIIKEVD